MSDGLAAPITVDPPAKIGQESVIAVTDDIGEPVAGLAVSVVLRPGLDGEKEIALGITDGLGRVRFTPDAGGLALVRADTEELPIAIGWGAAPEATLALLGALVVGAFAAIAFGTTRIRVPDRRRRA